MAKKKSAKRTPKDLSLEDAMEELQGIVDDLESGQESLDQSLGQFERGMELLRVCHQQLEHAAQRIEIVTRVDAEGNFETADFDGESTLQRSRNDPDAAPSKKLF